MIHYLDLGAGEPVFLVHGDLSTGAGAWSTQIAALPGRVRLLVPDRRGHGASPSGERPFTFAADAGDLLAVADRAGLASFHAVGHSRGAVVVFEAARIAPHRLRSLHLLEPPFLRLLPEDPEVAAMADRARELFRQAPVWRADRIAEEFVRMLAGDEALARARERPSWPAIVAEAGRIAGSEFPGDYVLDPKDVRIDGQIRVYRGGRSHPALRRIAAAAAALLPRAELIDLPDAGHEVQRSPAFNDILLREMGIP